jgi:hypothetical protein
LEFKITERDYQQLLRRFDPDNASRNAFGYNMIRASITCVNRRSKCRTCSFFTPNKEINCCSVLFKTMAGEPYSKYLYFFDHGILWDTRFDKEARYTLNKIKSQLAQAEKIE